MLCVIFPRAGGFGLASPINVVETRYQMGNSVKEGGEGGGGEDKRTQVVT